jgi:tetratricopeptide (TPR) repeat protein
MARKLALIIGNSQYDDAGLARLAAPDVDVRALAEVLSTPGIGAFDEVVPLLNEGLATVRRAIARFFDAKHRDDLLLLYFSGHGVRDEQGHLYFAVRDTERAILAGTAIEASYVTTRMDRSASKRLVLVLDCCHSGAFGYGAKAAQGATVGTATAFEGTGRGRVVLTATDSTQYAWEGDQVLGEVENSLFTHYMIEGLRTGAADRDEDGLITIDELYDYVYEHVLNDTPKQTPGKWAFGQQGDIVIAHNASASRSKLPPEIEEAVRSTLPSVRLEAVRELDIILRGRHPGRSNAAREVLKRLAEDDSRRVAAAAVEMLRAFELGGRPVKPETIAREIEIEKQKEVEQTARIETAQIEAAQVEAARVEAARVEAARLEAERLEAARVEAARVEAARVEAERLEAERLEAARVEAERVEAARVEAERVQAARVEAARVEAERVARAAAVAEQLVAAEAALTRGALDDARERLTKALEIEPQHAGALKLQGTLQQRIEERTRLAEAEQRIRELRQKIGTLIARANATDSDAEAIGLLDEALGLDPEHAEVKELLEERHRLRAEAEAAERRARSIATVQERITRHLERGDLEDAEHALASADALGAPAEVFAPLRERLAQLHDKRRRDAEEAIRLKAEAEKRARADEIARHLESARKAIGRQRFDDALEALRQASALDPNASGMAELVSSAEAGKAALEAEAKKRQEIDAQLNEASRHLTKGHLTKAIVITDVLLGLDPNHPAAKLLHEQIQKAIEGQKEAERKAAQERERQRQIEDMIATAEAAPTHDTAIEILNDVLRRDPGNAKAGRLLDKRQADLDALKAEQRRSEIAAAQQTIEEHLTRHELDLAGAALDAAEGRFQSTAEFRALRERLQGVRRKEEHDRLARAAIEQAQEDFARGNHQRAIAELSKFRPQHDRVSAAIRALKAQAEEIRRAKEEQEARARAEAERAAHEERVARLMAAAQAAVSQQRFQEALEAVEQLRALAPDVAGLEQLAKIAADGLKAQRAAEEARRQAEIARQEMDKTLARAAKRLRRRDYTAALGLVEEVLARDSQYPAALSLRAEVQRAVEEAAKHPVEGFSLWPTLSSATVWLRTKAIYSNTFRITSALVLAAAVAVGMWKSPADAPQSVESTPASTPASAGDPPSTGSPGSVTPPTTQTQVPDGAAPANPPPAAPAPTPAPVAPVNTRNEAVIRAEGSAREHLQAGNVDLALRSIEQGLAVDANDTGLQQLLADIFKNAQNRTTQASRAAEKSGPAALSSEEFAAAKSAQLDADQARKAGRNAQALRGYREAARLYGEAAKVTAVPPPSTPPPTVVTPPPVGVGPIVSTAKNLIAQGNLIGAARAIVEGLEDNPKNSDLLGTLQQVYSAAEAEASETRKAADAAGSSSRSEYTEGTSRLKSATSARSSRPEDAESVVRDYAAAAKLYRDAERLGKEKTGGGGAGPTADEAAVRRVLAEYAVAYSTMDVARVRRVKPSFKPYDQNLRTTVLNIISNPVVEFRDRYTAVATLTVQYRNTYRKGSFATNPPPQRVTWLLRRTSDGWIILE